MIADETEFSDEQHMLLRKELSGDAAWFCAVGIVALLVVGCVLSVAGLV